MTTLVAIQMSSSTSVADNLTTIANQLQKLDHQQQQLVLLPECCLFFGGKDQQQLALAHQAQQDNALTTALANLAKKFNVYLVAGSIPIAVKNTNKFTNSCVVFSPNGVELSRYDKLHLFDVEVADGEKNYLESRYTQPGKKVVTTAVSDITLGLTICYDLRFPELFRQLRQQGAQVITVPSAFTRVTGQAHWQALLQARAIENQVYIIAAGQEGVHENGRETWGHSMIINPWGEILVAQDSGEGIISAEFNVQELMAIQQAMPVAEHNRFKSKLK